MKRYLWILGLVAAGIVTVVVWDPLIGGAQSLWNRGGDRAEEESGATPRRPDGRPDLSGLWSVGSAARSLIDGNGNIAVGLGGREGSGANAERDGFLRRRMDPNRPVYKPEFWEKVQYLDDNQIAEDPYFHCNPLGVPRMGPPAKILQTDTEVIFFYEAPPAGGGRNAYRIIPLDRPHHPIASQDQTWMGDSVGHWDGDTLVVDVLGFNDVSWLDIPGYFHTTALHVVERLRREGDTLTYQVTIEDPNVLLEPWVRNPVTLNRVTDPTAYIIEDYPCNEKDFEHLVTTEHH
jgi:hypothetical protein